MTPRRSRRRNVTERVTVRLDSLLLAGIDAMITVGEFRDRTDAIHQAVRDMLNAKSANVEKAKQDIERLKRLAASVETLHHTQEDLLKE